MIWTQHRPLRPPEVTLICRLLEFYLSENYHLKHVDVCGYFLPFFSFRCFYAVLWSVFSLNLKWYIYLYIWISCLLLQCLTESGDVRWPYFFLTDTWMWLSSGISFNFNYLVAHFLTFYCLYSLYCIHPLNQSEWPRVWMVLYKYICHVLPRKY